MINENHRARVTVLEGRHMVSIVLYIGEHKDCRKMDLYKGVSTNPNMPSKLDMLEEAGIIVQTTRSDMRGVTLDLTDAGREIYECLLQMEEILEAPMDEEEDEEPQ